MTRNEAIKVSIRAWKKLASNGELRKKDLMKLWQYMAKCPLCQYASDEQWKMKSKLPYVHCKFCPYNEAHPRRRNQEGAYACKHPASPYSKWDMSNSVKFRERCAALFVAELEALLGSAVEEK